MPVEGLVYGLQNPNLGYSLYTLTVGRGVALAGGTIAAKSLQIKAFLALFYSLLTFSYKPQCVEALISKAIK